MSVRRDREMLLSLYTLKMCSKEEPQVIADAIELNTELLRPLDDYPPSC